MMLFAVFVSPVAAQEIPDSAGEEAPLAPLIVTNEYRIGEVRQILEDTVLDIEGFIQPYQRVVVEITRGVDAGETFEYDYQLPVKHTDSQKLEVGERVAVVKVTREGESEYYVAEKYRLPAVIWIFVAFFLLAIVFGGWKGLTSTLGLMFSLLIIV